MLLKGLDGILDFSELGLALFEHVQLLQQLSDALVFVVKFETFLCNENGIIHSLRSGKKIGITVNRLRTVGTQGHRLFECVIGFPQQAIFFLHTLRAKILGALWAQAPGINPRDGASEFGKSLLGPVITHKFGISLESGQITTLVGVRNEGHDFLDGGFIINPVTNQALHVLRPEKAIFSKIFLGEAGHRFTVDLEDDPEWREMRIHPFQRHAFLNVETVVRVFIKNHLGQEPIDGHDRCLPLNGNPPIGSFGDNLAWTQLIVGSTNRSIGHVFHISLVGICQGGCVDFLARVDSLGSTFIFHIGPHAHHGLIQGPGSSCQAVGREVEFFFRSGAKHFLEEGWILLSTAEIMGPDVIQIGTISQRILSNEIHISAIKIRISWLFRRWKKAFAKNHVGRVESSRIGSPKQDRTFIHLGIHLKRWGEHVMTKPVTKEMTSLLIFPPMTQYRVKRSQRENR